MRFSINVKCYDLAKTIESGQIFRYHEDDGVYTIYHEGFRCTAKQVGNLLTISDYESHSEEDKQWMQDYWTNFFAVDDDLDELREFMYQNAFLKRVYDENVGLHLLRQNPWETLVCFIISQQKRIPQIKEAVRNLCSEAGYYNWSSAYNSFPTPQDILNCNLSGLLLGYRADYIHSAAVTVKSGAIDLDPLRAGNATYKEAYNRLQEIYGVGAKIADCVCLFGLGHRDAFPVDIHIKRILALPEMSSFHVEDCGHLAGYVQQYLFKYALEHGI